MRLLRISQVILVVLFGWIATGAASAQQNSEIQQLADESILNARIAAAPERTRIVIDLSGETGYSTFPVSEPDRLVIELAVTGIDEKAPAEIEASGLVSKMSMGMISGELSRAVIFLNGPVQVTDIQLTKAEGNQPARLVIELAPGDRETFDAAVAAIATQIEANTKEDKAKALELELRSTLGATVDAEDVVPADPNAPPPAARPLIIIDPGHGGIDLGARAFDDTLEKTVVLKFSKILQAELAKLQRFDVALTRSGDSFLTLNERVQLARDNQANLFVSIHADSYDQPFARGSAVYIRDETATDVLDKVLADNENQVDLVAGFSPPKEAEVVVDILVDLMRRETRRQSFVAAQQLIGKMQSSMHMRPSPQRRADFFVLQAPDVPSVLIELGFLSNPDDLENIVNEAWQLRSAKLIAAGIAKYFDVSVQP